MYSLIKLTSFLSFLSTNFKLKYFINLVCFSSISIDKNLVIQKIPQKSEVKTCSLMLECFTYTLKSLIYSDKCRGTLFSPPPRESNTSHDVKTSSRKEKCHQQPMTHTLILVFICIHNHTFESFTINFYDRNTVARKHTNKFLKSFNTSIKKKLEHIIYYLCIYLYILSYI